jgi:hypothetical protein
MSSAALKQQIEIEIPELHSAQQQIVDESQRFNVLACGRRFGKSLLGIQLDLEPALEGYPVAWFSPTHKMLAEIWRDMSLILKPVTKRTAAQEHRLELITGGIVDMWSLDAADSTRGRKYKRAVVDEAAMVPGFKDAWEAVIRPTLTDYQGDAYWLSTPRGMNFFKQGYDYGQDPLKPDWMSWSFPSSANPYLPEGEVDKAREELPELTFKQEYLAEFLQSEGAVFRNIEANLIAEFDTEKKKLQTPDKHRDHRIVSGLDWAQKHDFTAHSIGCADCKVEVELDRFNKIEWAFQRGRIKQQCEKWGIQQILAEHNSIGGPNIEALQAEGLPVVSFETTAQSKGPLIQSLALALERNEYKWLNNPSATAELVAYESKVSTVTGRVSYSAPEGMNDDTVIARALMLKSVLDQGVSELDSELTELIADFRGR